MSRRRTVKSVDFGDGLPVSVEFVATLGVDPQGYPLLGGTKKEGIKLVAGAHPKELRITMLHELMHAASDKAHTQARGVSRKAEEQFISYVSGWLFEAFDRNPRLREWMFGETT